MPATRLPAFSSRNCQPRSMPNSRPTAAASASRCRISSSVIVSVYIRPGRDREKPKSRARRYSLALQAEAVHRDLVQRLARPDFGLGKGGLVDGVEIAFGFHAEGIVSAIGLAALAHRGPRPRIVAVKLQRRLGGQHLHHDAG